MPQERPEEEGHNHRPSRMHHRSHLAHIANYHPRITRDLGQNHNTPTHHMEPARSVRSKMRPEEDEHLMNESGINDTIRISQNILSHPEIDSSGSDMKSNCSQQTHLSIQSSAIATMPLQDLSALLLLLLYAVQGAHDREGIMSSVSLTPWNFEHGVNETERRYGWDAADNTSFVKQAIVLAMNCQKFTAKIAEHSHEWISRHFRVNSRFKAGGGAITMPWRKMNDSATTRGWAVDGFSASIIMPWLSVELTPHARVLPVSATVTNLASAPPQSISMTQEGSDSIDVYVVDTGINVTHSEFEGRTSWGRHDQCLFDEYDVLIMMPTSSITGEEMRRIASGQSWYNGKRTNKTGAATNLAIERRGEEIEINGR
ncbi:hypothetical protein EDB19DRAFT_1825227 [Suillus lakei]|nr:hypothetical protein EDB19DRAFT_1825227 [Suillus lakei]